MVLLIPTRNIFWARDSHSGLSKELVCLKRCNTEDLNLNGSGLALLWA